ncbi:interferon-induced, double-stranded RNA-activated protein kinase-like [Morone saxatilis]|uniref:interferon-induced, double-stranded RNA-activated protein kinase-like n=1 Tax=Morone saxatilis TaxID=34816 RepID=UPI0015E1E6EE|nr:interferon-induced, double-stranded RNA-activated protein kinase-like [Morone saxatilis]
MMEAVNYVSELNEYAQQTHSALDFKDLGRIGPDYRTFAQRAVLNGKVYPDGLGKTKKEAKHSAAKNALKCLSENQHRDSVDSILGAAAAPSAPLLPVSMVKTADENYNCTLSQQKQESNQNVSNICNKTRSLSVDSQLYRYKPRQRETNYIGIVNHYCQKTRRCLSFIEVRRCGPSHKPQFFYKLVINNKDYPVGEGQTAKEAKQDAARLAWSALLEQSDYDSQVSIRSTVSEDGASMLSVRSPTQESHESPSQSTSTSISSSGILTDTSTPSNAQISFRSAVPEDDAPTSLSTQPTLESHESSSQSTSVSTGGSIIFADTSNPSEGQMSIRSIAPQDDAPTRLSTSDSLESLTSSQSMSIGTSGSEKFTDSSNSSKDQDAVKDMNMGNSRNETSAQSRFTSDFDSIDCVGSGAYGWVYKARSKVLDIYCAVKIVRCEEKSLREPGTLSKLLHPNIVRYYRSWMEDSGYQGEISADSSNNSPSKYLYIQLELCDSKTLKAWINKKNTQSPQDSKRREESLSIAQQIVSGVEYIHSEKHIHRDLKPDNILFGMGGEVKIGDFGLVTKDDAWMDRTRNKGTPTYMAPEQKGNNYGRKVDIFPLGLIYLELLWKVSSGHERGNVLDNARSQKFPKDFTLNFPQEKQIINSLLCEQPEDRPEASTLKAELKKWAQTFSKQNVRKKNLTL